MEKATRRHGWFATAQRLARAEVMLASSSGLSISDLAERLGISERTVQRYVRQLEERGLAIAEEWEGHRKLLRIISERRGPIIFGARELLSLEVARNVMRAFRGTGMDVDMDSIVGKIDATLGERALALVGRFRAKIRCVEDGAYEYGDREEDFNQILTALIAEHQLELRHIAVGRSGTLFRVDPYAVLIYRRGVYVVGLSHHHESVRTFGLDGIAGVRWLKREPFSMPEDFDVDRLVGGAFGLIVGATTEVRLRFDASVARYVQRRRWHPSQQFVRTRKGFEMQLRVDGTKELSSWILGFGSKVEVLAPAMLREEIAREQRRGSERNHVVIDVQRERHTTPSRSPRSDR